MTGLDLGETAVEPLFVAVDRHDHDRPDVARRAEILVERLAAPGPLHDHPVGPPFALHLEHRAPQVEIVEPLAEHIEPMLNVSCKEGDTIRHFWGSELAFAPEDPGQDNRGLDFIDLAWGLLDTTPEGRGGTFFPKVDS